MDIRCTRSARRKRTIEQSTASLHCGGKCWEGYDCASEANTIRVNGNDYCCYSTVPSISQFNTEVSCDCGPYETNGCLIPLAQCSNIQDYNTVYLGSDEFCFPPALWGEDPATLLNPPSLQHCDPRQRSWFGVWNSKPASWTAWSSCSVTCGRLGTQTRTCVGIKSNLQLKCEPDADGTLTTRSCGTADACPESKWSEWGACSPNAGQPSCGDVQGSQQRTCIVPPGLAAFCVGSSVQSCTYAYGAKCIEHKWGEWGPCYALAGQPDCGYVEGDQRRTCLSGSCVGSSSQTCMIFQGKNCGGDLSSSSSEAGVGVIVGASVGGAVALAVLATGGWYCYKRRQGPTTAAKPTTTTADISLNVL